MTKIEIEVEDLTSLYVALLDAERCIIRWGNHEEQNSAMEIRKVIEQVKLRTNAELMLSPKTLEKKITDRNGNE